ncbi:IS110 family RNA-guided transposase [Paraburkholderia sprentiae]|uniref:IS110 family transposase n=1 Tax=Paraburkholderia sprentiae TaxID=948107 RepID=UPI00042468CD|nr:IS110 family transposase [Paraburkholderia sprentiae]
MQDVTLVGIDLGKHPFHLHGQDRRGKAVFRKSVGRKQLLEFFAKFHACTMVMEPCAGAHHTARKLVSLGYRVKLISPQFGRPFVKSNKNDFVEAEAICDAASRPAMRFVTRKTNHSGRCQPCIGSAIRWPVIGLKPSIRCTAFCLSSASACRSATPLSNACRRVLAEHSLPPHIVAILERLHAHFKYLSEQIAEIDKEMTRQLADDEFGQRLLNFPGVGPITASVLSAEMGDGKQPGCSRDFAASLGLVPRQYSTGGRANLLGISKRGDKNIRRLLVQCARAYMQRLGRQSGPLADWGRALLARRHSNVVACALANKLARTAWALATRNTVFDAKAAVMPA